jgi:hypothetical protein
VDAISLSAQVAQLMPDAIGAQDTKDGRIDPRNTVRRCGWFVRQKGEQLRECVVWDESQTGARLVVKAPETIPDTFYIYMSLDYTSRRHCRVVWRSSKEIGVEFLT